MRKFYIVKDKEYTNLYDALDFNKYENEVIAFIGGGGKTTTILNLAKELNRRQKKVVIMTSTNMMYPYSKVYDKLDENLIYALKNKKEIWIGEKVIKDNGISKLKSPTNEVYNYVLENRKKYGLTILNEADGAKRKPIKVPRDYEPVILEETKLVVALVGADAINQKIEDVSARIDDMEEFLSKSKYDIIDINDIMKIILSKDGYKKDVTTYMDFSVVINKADRNLEEAKKLVSILEDKVNIVIAKQI